MEMFKRLLSIFKNPEPDIKVIDHPDLGRLEWEPEDWWKGSFSHRGSHFAIFLAGHDAPDPVSVQKCKEAIHSFDDIKKRVEHLVSATLSRYSHMTADISVEDFVIESLSFLWPQKPDYCMIFFTNEKDKDGLWKCEMTNCQPQYLTRDD